MGYTLIREYTKINEFGLGGLRKANVRGTLEEYVRDRKEEWMKEGFEIVDEQWVDKETWKAKVFEDGQWARKEITTKEGAM